MDAVWVDSLVQQLNNEISPKIDCTKCGNCCKTLMINVSEQEADHLSQHLQLNRTDFDEQYLEKGSNGMMLMNSIPCSFLSNNKCNVYEYRFEGCREFPAMHLPGFGKRLFTTLMHYGRCPIIFNIVEEMKKQISDV
jgi:Fe-S-cluster containining protein